MRRSDIATVPCQICGDTSYGRHYGLWTCDGCSCFFKRSIRRNITYKCVSGKNNCPIDKSRRNWCSACRLQKCFNLRMNRNAVQKERGPRKKYVKLSNLTIEGIAKSSSSPSSNKNDLNFQLRAKIMKRLLDETMHCPIFDVVDPVKKLEICLKNWPGLLYLHESNSPPESANSHNVEIDKEERRLLCCIYLCTLNYPELNFAKPLMPIYGAWLQRHCVANYKNGAERIEELVKRLWLAITYNRNAKF